MDRAALRIIGVVIIAAGAAEAAEPAASRFELVSFSVEHPTWKYSEDRVDSGEWAPVSPGDIPLAVSTEQVPELTGFQGRVIREKFGLREIDALTLVKKDGDLRLRAGSFWSPAAFANREQTLELLRAAFLTFAADIDHISGVSCLRYDAVLEEKDDGPSGRASLLTRRWLCPHPEAPALIIDIAGAAHARKGAELAVKESLAKAVDTFASTLRFTPLSTTATPPGALSSHIVPIGQLVQGIAVGHGSIWAALIGGSVVRVSRESGRPIARIRVGHRAVGVTVTEDAVWVAADWDSVARIDPLTNTVVVKISVGEETLGVHAGEGSIWVTARRNKQVVRIDPDSNLVVARISVRRRLDPNGPSGLTTGEGGVWVANFRSVVRIDPQTNRVAASIGGVNAAEFVHVAAGSVWVSSGENYVLRIDPVTNRRTARISFGGSLQGLAFSGGKIWVVDQGWSQNPLVGLVQGFKPPPIGKLSQIDVNTNQRIQSDLLLGRNSLFITADGDDLWIGDSGTLIHVSPATLRERSGLN